MLFFFSLRGNSLHFSALYFALWLLMTRMKSGRMWCHHPHFWTDRKCKEENEPNIVGRDPRRDIPGEVEGPSTIILSSHSRSIDGESWGERGWEPSFFLSMRSFRREGRLLEQSLAIEMTEYKWLLKQSIHNRNLKIRWSPWPAGSLGWGIIPYAKRLQVQFPARAHYLGCGFNSQLGQVWEATDRFFSHQCYSLSLFFFLSFSPSFLLCLSLSLCLSLPLPCLPLSLKSILKNVPGWG